MKPIKEAEIIAWDLEVISRFEEESRAMVSSQHPGHIRPEVQQLAKRGQITLKEWKNFRGNSYEMELLTPQLDDEAYLYYAENCLKNCQCDRSKPRSSYNEAVILDIAPELLRRLALKQ